MTFYGRLALCPCLFGIAKADSREHVLVIDNRVDRFEALYAHATLHPMDSDSRFSLWQKEDGLAAVPPGAAGDAMARRLVDAAWDKYPALMRRLPALNAEAERTARDLFARDNELLGTGTDTIRARLVLYVGQFDDNAYTMPAVSDKPPTVLMPVESPILKLFLAHELTHAIHLQLADIRNSFGAPVGETMFMEGLAMHTAQRAVPGLPDAAYTEMPDDKGRFARCSAHKDAVLKGIYSDLDKSGTGIAMKYTFAATPACRAKLIAPLGLPWRSCPAAARVLPISLAFLKTTGGRRHQPRLSALQGLGAVVSATAQDLGGRQSDDDRRLPLYAQSPLSVPPPA